MQKVSADIIYHPPAVIFCGLTEHLAGLNDAKF